MVTYLRSVDSGTSVLRVITLRPTTFAVVIIITAGCLAALPFRREGEQRLDRTTSQSQGGGENDSITASSSAWPQYPGFDPSLAWQPVPMTLPERPLAAQPPMPDSYYDLAFELERPEPVRERFGAVAETTAARSRAAEREVNEEALDDRVAADRVATDRGADEQAADHEESAEKRFADRFTREPVRAIRPASQRSAEAESEASDSPGKSATAASRDQDFHAWATRRPNETQSPPTADDLITDRFEFTPIEPVASRRRWPTDPPVAALRSAIRNASTGPTQQDAGQTTHDRPRYFIREPD